MLNFLLIKRISPSSISLIIDLALNIVQSKHQASLLILRLRVLPMTVRELLNALESASFVNLLQKSLLSFDQRIPLHIVNLSNLTKSGAIFRSSCLKLNEFFKFNVSSQ